MAVSSADGAPALGGSGSTGPARPGPPSSGATQGAHPDRVTAMSRAERDHLTSDLRMACMRISRRVRFESSAPVAPHQFSVLVRLEDGPRNPKELAEIERVSAPSMTRTVNGLVDAGLVDRGDDPHDGRLVILSLTSQGRRAIRDTRRRRDQWLALRLERLSDDERALLADATALLERMAAE